MNQITKNNILQEIREMRDKKLGKFKDILKTENQNNTYMVGMKFGIDMTCKAMEEIVKNM